MLDLHMKGTVNNEYLVDEAHDTPTWLYDACAAHVSKNKNDDNGDGEAGTGKHNKAVAKEKNSGDGNITKRKSIVASFFSWKLQLVIAMVVFIAWCLFISFLT